MKLKDVLSITLYRDINDAPRCNKDMKSARYEVKVCLNWKG